MSQRAALVRELMVCLRAKPSEARNLGRSFAERNRSPMVSRRPWWPYPVIEYVGSNLRAAARVFEYGGGGSTLWLRDRGATVTCVEHDQHWHRELAKNLGSDVLLRVPSDTGTLRGAENAGFFDDYVETINQFEDESLDLVVIDGRARVACALAARSKVRPGGMLLLDDSDRKRYLPAIEALVTWNRFRERGLKPGLLVAETSVWTRPA